MNPETNEREIDLAALDISVAQAADLRARLHTFAEDWESPEMDIYDDYDTNLAALRRTDSQTHD